MKVTTLVSAASLVACCAAHSHTKVTALLRRPNQSGPEVLPPSEDPWYTGPPGYEWATPGQILRIRPARGNLTTIQANSSAAYNILYRTTNSLYLPDWAVTTFFVPNNTVFNSNDKLLSYQIPYDSADVDASPSYSLYSGGIDDITEALGKGYYVNVPDYEGPKASFTAGVQSGHATIDSIRAVLSSGFGLAPNGTRYALWGYSGGALASEWAAELQQQYAPELNFAGAALGGLTPNVSDTLVAVDGTIEAGLIPSGILGLASQYPDLMKYIVDNLNPSGQYNASYFLMAKNQSLIGSIGAFVGQDLTKYFKNGVSTLFSPIAQKVINRDGVMGYHGVPQTPIFAYKAIADEVSPIAGTDKLVEKYCGIGVSIRYDRNTVGSHTTESGNGEARATEWLDTVLSGHYNVTGCQIRNVTINGTSSS